MSHNPSVCISYSTGQPSFIRMSFECHAESCPIRAVSSLDADLVLDPEFDIEFDSSMTTAEVPEENGIRECLTSGSFLLVIAL